MQATDMPDLHEVSEIILSRRTERDVDRLSMSIERLEGAIVSCGHELVDTIRDKQALEAAFRLLAGSDKLLPVAHELNVVALQERRLHGKKEKLEGELEELRDQKRRWLALRSVLSVRR